jgi:IS5 family transposase
MLAQEPICRSNTGSLIADSAYIYRSLVPKDHILCLIKASVDFSFARGLVEDLYCLDNGRPGISPETLCRISLLQHLYNLSDRQVVEQCRDNLVFKFFLGLAVEDPAPCDATTLSRVRTRWGLDVFKRFFENTVAQAQVKGILGTKRVVDSSKTLMNAAVMRSSELLRQLCARLAVDLEGIGAEQSEVSTRLKEEERYLQEDTSWLLTDELKRQSYLRWGIYAAELLEYAQSIVSKCNERMDLSDKEHKRLERATFSAGLLAKHLDDKAVEAAMKAKQARAEEARAKKHPEVKKAGETKKRVYYPGRRDKIVSPVDPEARQAADRKKKVKAGYKTHVSMDSDSEIVTSVVVTPMNCDDGPILPVLVEEESQRNLVIEEIAADRAYADGAVREALAARSIEAYIPEPACKPGGEGKFISWQFHFDGEKKTLTCPAGQEAVSGRLKGANYFFYFTHACCAVCPMRASCLSETEIKEGIRRGRSVTVSRYRPLHEAARAKQETAEHKNAMKYRLAVEHKQGEMLNQRGLRHGRYRGLMKTSIQAYLVAGVTNIRRMAMLCFRQRQKEQMMYASG